MCSAWSSARARCFSAYSPMLTHAQEEVSCAVELCPKYAGEHDPTTSSGLLWQCWVQIRWYGDAARPSVPPHHAERPVDSMHSGPCKSVMLTDGTCTDCRAWRLRTALHGVLVGMSSWHDATGCAPLSPLQKLGGSPTVQSSCARAWSVLKACDCLRIAQASIIVFLLALVIATGVVLTAAFGGRKAILDLVRHRDLAFSSLCSSSASS